MRYELVTAGLMLAGQVHVGGSMMGKRAYVAKATTIIMAVASTMHVILGRIHPPTGVPFDSPVPPHGFSILAPGVVVTPCRSLTPRMPFCVPMTSPLTRARR
jgi:hypothetical protein